MFASSRHVLPFAALALLSACASYQTPGAAFHFDDTQVAAMPTGGASLLNFPLRIAVARVQASGYRSHSVQGHGSGDFSALEATTDQQGGGALLAISHWPGVDGVVTVDPSTLPATFDSLADLRLAAAKQRADVLLVYSLDTVFETAASALPPQTPLKPGKAPDGARIRSEARGQLIDVRTGLVNGVAQGSAAQADLAASWADAKTLDAQRLQVEQAAITQLVDDASKSWARIADAAAR